MSVEENKKLARRLIDEAWNKGNMAALDELLAADFVSHETPNPFDPPHGEGREGEKQDVLYNRTAFPDAYFTIEDQIAEGDLVVTRWTARGAHTGPLGRIPPTGRQATTTGVFIYRFADGKAVERWTNFDALGLLLQLGVLPMPGG
jgi:predicted ester cyclase